MKTVLILMVCVGGLFTACPSPKTTNERHTPKPVKWTQVAVGREHTVAIDQDGTLWAWGSNKDGQLGNGDGGKDATGEVNKETVPIPITNPFGVTAWKKVSAGYAHTVAIAQDDTLWAWGSNHRGQLGTGESGKYKDKPTKIGDKAWKQVSAGTNYTVAITEDGTLYAWGNNVKGQLGNGDSGMLGSGEDKKETAPTKVKTSVTKWMQVAAGTFHTVAVAQDGTLYAWGSNVKGQLGNGDTVDYAMPTKIGDKAWKQVAAGESHTVAVAQDGTLYAWGSNNRGQLTLGTGSGDTEDKHIPTPVTNLPSVTNPSSVTKWKQVAAGESHTVAIDQYGVLYAWGDETHGQLGIGDTLPGYKPVQVTNPSSSVTKWTQVFAGASHTVAIAQDGTLWAWGRNKRGQLGNGESGHDKKETTPTRISLLK